ncbi:23S rRNA (pseudouridine(1915)-N(3))-methyltransferase RlmH [Pseudogracilibacillus sp. SO30301A]|uniref:23S rRNA (pseudouridine(1915)-N(3))-methyltransferase RlmH n=1 Tax=Pseudogracilibacillus sp. SO30301A TaxID=3098291 RepID=UPI00300E6C67
MNIHIITVGKVREKYIKLGIQEFEKRLSSYCKLTFSELMDEQAPEQLNEKELLSVKKKEGERILNKIKQDHYVIALDIKGVSWSSEQFSKELENLSFQGKNQVTFIIGGSNGLSEEVLRRANLKLSFSKMTFPHQLMKLILLEQVYRAFKIQRGEPYHK